MSTKKTTTEVNNTTATEEAAKKFRTVRVEVGGAKKKYPLRYTPLKALKAHNTVEGKLEYNDEDNVWVVNVADEKTGEFLPCGMVLEEIGDSTTVKASQFEDILSRYKDADGNLPEMELELKDILTNSGASINMVAEIKIYGQTAIEEATEKLAESSEMDKDAFEELKKWLDTLKLSEKALAGWFDIIKTNKNQDAARIPKRTVFNNYDEVVEDIIFSIVSNANTMLEGPMAAGKNTCLECIAGYAGKALYEIQVNSFIDNDTLLGTRTIVAKQDAAEAAKINEEGMKLIQALSGMSNKATLKKAIEDEENPDGQQAAVEAVQEASGIDFTILLNAMKNGQTEVSFQPSVLVTAMERGSWLVIDEFNTGAPSVMAVLNSVLDARKRIQVPGYGLVTAQEGFRVFATMNPEYEGTFALNPATSSRFNHVMFRAADKISPIILSRVPKADKKFLQAAEKIYAELRKSIATGQFSQESMNIRGFIEAAKMVELGRGIRKSLLTCVANGIIETDDRNAIKSVIELQISD